MCQVQNGLTMEEIKRVFESFTDGVLITDAHGNVLMHNQAYIQKTFKPFNDSLAGMNLRDINLIGMNMRDIIKVIGRTKAAALMVLDEMNPVTMTHSSESGTIMVTSNPLFDVEGSLNMVITYVREITDYVRLHEELNEIKSLEEMYYQTLQDDYSQEQGQPVAASRIMKETLNLAQRLAPVEATILLTGESGVGKDVLARYIHENSPRSKSPYIAVNCGALPENLLESELFGYAPGAFTGASRTGKTGLFEAANGGTLFLDEIAETSPNMQVALLRVLENRELIRVGSAQKIPVNVRIIAATNRNLEDMVNHETFRYDLFYRLNVLQIKIPPLRERQEDIVRLSMHFLHLFNKQYRQNKNMSHEVLRQLVKYDWPGNVRELKNAIERAVLMSKGNFLSNAFLPEPLQSSTNTQPTVIVSGVMPLNSAVEEVEKQVLINAFNAYGTTRQVAKALGVDHSTVIRKTRKYKIFGDD